MIDMVTTTIKITKEEMIKWIEDNFNQFQTVAVMTNLTAVTGEMISQSVQFTKVIEEADI